MVDDARRKPGRLRRKLEGFLKIGVVVQHQFLAQRGEIVEYLLGLQRVDVRQCGGIVKRQRVQMLPDVRRGEGEAVAPPAKFQIGILDDAAADDQRNMGDHGILVLWSMVSPQFRP